MNRFIGLISGTSADGIDAICIDINDTIEVLASETFPYSPELKQEVLDLSQPAKDGQHHRIDRLGHLDHKLGKAFAEAALTLCQNANIETNTITAIGSHGQTVRHRPQGSDHFSFQIGDPNVIALETNITTIADFRRMDMAAGGQGAPLVPLFHQRLFSHPEKNRIVLNLGGIANLSWLPKNQGATVGFDTGPANALMDMWIQKHQGHAFDSNGDWAATGNVDHELLKHMLADPYFKIPAPKSTGREYFDEQWLEQKLRGVDPLSPEDIQATLLELTARSIAEQLSLLAERCDELFVCGGGAHNQVLLERLAHQLPAGTEIASLDDSLIAGDFIEAATFAWLAERRLAEQELDYRTVTGASKPLLYGNIFRATASPESAVRR